MKKALSVILVAMLFLALVPSAMAEPTTIRYAHGWSPSGDTAYGAQQIADWAAAHKDTVNLVEEVVAGDEMMTKIKIDIASDNLPDAWMYWGSMSELGAFIDAGLLADVDEYFSRSTQTKRSDYDEGIFDSFRFDGVAYGIPTEAYVGSWLCNSELFEKYGLEYPETYEDLLHVSEVFNANGIIPIAMGSKSGNPSHFFMSELFCQYEGAAEDFAKLSSEWIIDTPNFRKTMDAIVDMRNHKMFPADTISNGDWGPYFALYDQEKAAMVFAFTWSLRALSPETAAKTVQIAAPKMPGANVDPKTFVASNSTYGIVFNAASFKDPAKAAALVELGDLFTSDEWVEGQFYVLGSLNAKPIEIDESKMEMKLLADVLKYAEDKDKMSCHWLSYPIGEAFNKMNEYIDLLFAGSMDADEFVTKCQQSLDTIREDLE